MRSAIAGDPREARLNGNRCFCTECGEYFTTVRNFDRHQLVNKPCVDPLSVGLVKNDIGYWQIPASETYEFSAMERE